MLEFNVINFRAINHKGTKDTKEEFLRNYFPELMAYITSYSRHSFRELSSLASIFVYFVCLWLILLSIFLSIKLAILV